VYLAVLHNLIKALEPKANESRFIPDVRKTIIIGDLQSESAYWKKFRSSFCSRSTV
jgi:hypothetical protein